MQIWHSVGARHESHESEASYTLFPRKVLLHRRFGPYCFAFPKRLCVTECPHKRVKSSAAKKMFLFSYIVRL